MPLPTPKVITGFSTLAVDTTAHWEASTLPLPANLMAVSMDTGVPRIRIGTGTDVFSLLKEYVLLSPADTLVLDGGDAETV